MTSAIPLPSNGDYAVIQVPIGNLKVDRSGGLQRDHEDSWIEELKNTWDQRKVGVLVCSGRDDGSIIVLDGQQRLAALRQKIAEADPQLRHQLPHSMWCEVLYHLTSQEEGDIFVGRNHRRNVAPIYLFRNRVRAEEPTALEIDRLLKRHHTTVDFSIVNGYRCVDRLERLYGWGVLEQAIFTNEEVWARSNPYLSREAPFVEGLGLFYLTGTLTNHFNVKRAIESISVGSDLKTMRFKARQDASANRTSQARELANIFRSRYDHGKTHDDRMPEIVRPRSRS